MFTFSVGIDTVRDVVRKGTMWFIRDPQSPDFHPVREILERDSTTQVRKIAISGLLYGGVILATVGVNVLFLRYAVSGVLPLRWVYGCVPYSLANGDLPTSFVAQTIVRFPSPRPHHLPLHHPSHDPPDRPSHPSSQAFRQRLQDRSAPPPPHLVHLWRARSS